jgi:hypothetical protein
MRNSRYKISLIKTILVLNTSASMQIALAAGSHLAEGQFLLTLKNSKVSYSSQSHRAETFGS